MNIHNIRKKAGSFGFNLFFVLLLIGLIYIFIFPLLTIIITAISSPESSADPTVLWVPKKVSAVGIKTAMELMNFLPSLGLTAEISVLATLASCIACSLAGYGLARFKFPGKNLIFNLVVWSLLFTGGVTEIPVYLVMSTIGIIDTYFAYWLPEIAATMGVFLLKQNMAEIPDAMIEAARIDGAGEWKILWSIVMPSIKPAWLTLAIFSFQRNWNATASSYIYTETLKTLPTALSQITAAGSVARAGEAYAASVLMMIPPIIFFIFAQSSTVKTMAHAGIKG